MSDQPARPEVTIDPENVQAMCRIIDHELPAPTSPKECMEQAQATLTFSAVRAVQAVGLYQPHPNIPCPIAQRLIDRMEDAVQKFFDELSKEMDPK